MQSSETPSSGRPYAGASAADRSAERYRRLREAALDLVDEHGTAGLTVGGICTRASVAKRYFYDEVSSVDALLTRILGEALAGAAAQVAEDARTWDGVAIESLVEVAVSAVLGVFDDARMARLYLESPHYPGLRAARESAVEAFVGQFVDLLAVDDSHREGARLLVHVVMAGTTEGVALWLRGDLRLERAELAGHLVALGAQTAQLIRDL